jgi:hypothetical protein
VRGRKSIRAEHKKACDAIAALERKARKAGYNGGPVADDMDQYRKLHAIKDTLEWVHIGLIKTKNKPTDRGYFRELQEMGHRFYDLGPVRATLTWG